MEVSMEFGDWLRAEIKRRDLTITQFAEVAGVTQAAVSRWLGGQRRPDVASTQRIALALGLPAEVVLEMAGHEIVGVQQLDTLQRELVRLQAERNALAHQGGEVQQRLTALDRRITELAEQEARIRRAEAAQEPMGALLPLPGTAAPMGEQDDLEWLGDTSDYLRAAGPVEEEPLTRRRSISAALSLVEGLLPEPKRMGIEFLHEFREEWSERERDAFALGLQIGLRLADALESRFSGQSGVDADSSSTEVRPDTDEK
jgi:transcriptional regulator with XRE-family HTH domain